MSSTLNRLPRVLAILFSAVVLLPACEYQEDAARKKEKEADERITVMNEINKTLRTQYGVAIINERHLQPSIEVIESTEDPEQLGAIEKEINRFIELGIEVQKVDEREDVTIAARPQVDRALENSYKILERIQVKRNQYYSF